MLGKFEVLAHWTVVMHARCWLSYQLCTQVITMCLSVATLTCPLPSHSVCSKYCQFQLQSNITSWKLCSVSMRLAKIAHTASGLQYILGWVVFVKLHPQEVLADTGRKLQSELLRWRWWSIWHMGGGGWPGVWKTWNARTAETVKVRKLRCACSLEY